MISKKFRADKITPLFLISTRTTIKIKKLFFEDLSSLFRTNLRSPSDYSILLQICAKSLPPPHERFSEQHGFFKTLAQEAQSDEKVFLRMITLII